MKKLIITAAIVCAAVVTQAASVKWECTGSNSDVDTKVYLLTSVSATYDSLAAFEATAISSASIAEVGARTKSYTTGQIDASADTLLKTAPYYIAVVDGNTIHIQDVAAGAGKVFDPAAQESTPGAFTTTLATIEGSSHTAMIQDVPEPTSGLLLLLGMAGLALKRRRA